MEKILPGDIVLADRGFDIAEDLAILQASLKIPAFTRGQSQLSPIDIEKTQELVNVRIHVERVIGATRQQLYSTFMSTLPIEYVTPKLSGDKTTIGKKIRVCSAHNNLCASVVPFT